MLLPLRSALVTCRISVITADKWMERHQIHCSGHAKGKDLFEIVKTIDAKMLFPIHSEHPETYVRVTRNMTVVEEGKSYSI